MQIKRRRIQFEPVPIDARASLLVREFKQKTFPFCWHYHPELEIDLVIKGHGLRFVGDSVQNFRDGDLCFLGSDLPHSWVSEPSARQSVHSLVIQFLPNCFGSNFFDAPELRCIKELFVRVKQGLRVDGDTRRCVAEKIIAMRHIPHGSWQQMHHLLGILGSLAESSECTPLAANGLESLWNEKANKRLQLVLNFINAEPSRIPSQTEIASKARLSPSAFSRFFKRCMGKTYVEYITELKIGMVCRTLIETDQSISEIAYAAGFNNLSNFNNHFRRIKQMAPREYRRLVQLETAVAKQH